MRLRGVTITGLEGKPEAILSAALGEASLPGPLRVWGNPEILLAPRAAIAGSRQASPRSLAAIEGLAVALAQRGLCLVSGGAHGTDCAAHAACLGAGGRTVVVLPCALEDIDLATWRPRLAGLWNEERTLFVSPFAPGYRPTRSSPVLRNRLIASLAQAAVAGETGLQGGTNHFLTFAHERRLPIFLLDVYGEDPAMAQALALFRQQGARTFTPDDAFSGGFADHIARAATVWRPAPRPGGQLALFGEDAP
ncbi:MAG: DNA-processing protein DprA [Sumerlaeia bacterium]